MKFNDIYFVVYVSIKIFIISLDNSGNLKNDKTNTSEYKFSRTSRYNVIF